MPTPLHQKLGIKENQKILLLNQPAHYFDLFDHWPDYTTIHYQLDQSQFDFMHLFFTSYIDLQTDIRAYKNALNKTGLMWISWPKGSSKINTDLKRDLIREYLLDVGLVDVKVCAIDDDWSALKFVWRVKDR